MMLLYPQYLYYFHLNNIPSKRSKTMLEAGDKAPEFSVQNQDGDIVSLTDHVGKNIIFWFYPRASTPGWTREGKGFRDRIQQLGDNNTIVLGISNDSPPKNKKFHEKHAFPFDLLCDEDLAISIAYGAAEDAEAGKAKRISYLIGTDGNILKAYKTVKAAEHPEQVLDDLKSFL